MSADDPAFPSPVCFHLDNKNYCEIQFQLSSGLTKRELFAAMIMAQLTGYEDERAAQMAVIAADALIAELEKRSGE